MAIDTSSTDSGITIDTTMPDRILRHNISDEELESLCAMSSSHLVEAMWVSLGTFLGFLPTSISAINNAFFVASSNATDIANPMSGGDFIQVLFCMASFVLFVSVWLVVRGKKDNTTQLLEVIRQRGDS